jgi:hypothetical protein
VIFIKKADIVLTNDHWMVAVNLKFTPFEREIEILRADMEVVEKVTHLTSLINELLRVQTACQAFGKQVQKCETLSDETRTQTWSTECRWVNFEINIWYSYSR